MSLNVENLNTLIVHLEAQPPERINMGYSSFREYERGCGSVGCIMGHSEAALGEFHLERSLKLPSNKANDLTHPVGYWDERKYVHRYPAHRVIATLKRLRDHYFATGEIIIDWGPEPGEEAAAETRASWSAPQAVEVIKPPLPPELTDLLRAPQPADLAREG